MKENKEDYIVKGNADSYLKELLEANGIEEYNTPRAIYDSGRSAIKRNINSDIQRVLKPFIQSSQLFVEFESNRDITGHGYPVNKKLEVVDFSLNNMNSSHSEVTIDGESYIRTNPFNGRSTYRLSYLENDITVTGRHYFGTSECKFFIKRSNDIYYLDNIEKSIKNESKIFEELKKKLSSVENNIETLEWIRSYMVENKLKREIKEVLKTNMIFEALAQKQSEEDKKTTVAEILSINV